MEQRFFFIHVMKTAGTTLALQLEQQFRGAEIYPSAEFDGADAAHLHIYVSVDHLYTLTPARQAEIRMYGGHLPFMASELVGTDVTTLTLLREPVARTISVLKHFKRLHERYRDLPLAAIYDDDVVFSQFVENHQTRIFSVTRADQPDAFSSPANYETILAALGPDRDPELVTRLRASSVTIDRARLDAAKRNLATVDVVGLTSHYADFIGELRRRFGWWPTGLDAGARANVSAEPWDVDQSLRTRIAADNTYDVELYRYAAELVEQRAGRNEPV